MIAAVFLLGAIVLHCSNDAASKNTACVPSHEMACFMPADYLNSSGPVSIEVYVGKKLTISLDHVSEYSVCRWIGGAKPALTVENGSPSMVLPPLSETDSGEYTLTCDTSSESQFLMNVSLHVVRKLPTKPKLMLECVEDKKKSPSFTCISEGYPNPTFQWSGHKVEKSSHSKSGKSFSTISSSEYADTGMMCCATNSEGQECSQLYDYDVDTDVMKKDEVTNVTISPGQSLLLRCHVEGFYSPSPVWEDSHTTMNAATFECSSKANEICVKNDTHDDIRMAYLFIESVKLHHSGKYTCKNSKKEIKKSVSINVQAEGFLSVQLDKRKVIPAQNASSSCLEASISHHPTLQHCSWDTPDKTVTKCKKKMWVTEHRTVKLCEPLTSGDYKLNLEAGGQKETRTISVCVVDEPKFKFRINEAIDIFRVEATSLLPANSTWMSSSLHNVSCDEDIPWNEIQNFSQTHSGFHCNKTIESSLPRNQVDGQCLRFCLTNSVGSWCKTQLIINPMPKADFSIGKKEKDLSFMALKVGIFLLLLVLTIVSIMLVYFIKKKKPQYQPQLQMIQMVGPNDNDYIYINFKDFEYDLKWEFPRENLELGKELGSGAFGMVLQATAYGIDKPGISQQVAVKMLKEKHQTVEKEALMSELKMLTHIGHHANIVNLLGACTESGPTYLIFQYCCHGDLLNYLKKNREHYHKSVTDAFNKDRFSSLYLNLQSRKDLSQQDRSKDGYVPMSLSTTRGQEDIALQILNSGDSFEVPEVYANLDDEIEDLQTLTFDDLLSFAFQVAKGMEFLSSKNCIHRDLAARNVLVTKGRLVKIGDFGLARDIDSDSNYVVRGNVRLPVKWMAPESTFQGIYTMKSDVWAYGILLWEIFSLGVTPYPGMKVDHTFYSMIERGFKMECPYYANETVYEIMCKCWALDPCNRPSFSQLVSFMCDQLTNREEKLYHNMLNQTPSDYQNRTTIFEISELTKQNENKATNDYCPTHATEESKEKISDSAKEMLLKPCDT